MSYIKFEKVSYSIRGKNILEDLSLEIAKDQFVTMIGLNGSGKTTFTKLLLGIIEPSDGEIWLDASPIKSYQRYEIGSKLGYLFQNPNVQIFAPTIQEELSFALEYKGLEAKIIKERADEMIERFSLGNALKTPTYHLSQGEKQRLAMGAMLMNQPEFLVLDEPTTGLDYKQKKVLAKTLKSIHKEGIGVLLISHDQAFVKGMPGKVIRLQDGGVTYET